MEDQPLSDADARTLRFLRWLVIVLTATMILGMAALVALFATRFPASDPRPPVDLSLPDGFDVPAGVRVSAVTRARDFWVVVTDAGEVLFFAPAGGAPVRRVPAGE